MSTEIKQILKSDFVKLVLDPSPEVIMKYNRDLDIVMQQKFKCECFTQNLMVEVVRPITAKEVAVLFQLDEIADYEEIKAHVQKARDRSIQQRDEIIADKTKMVATVRASVNDQVLNMVEKAAGYDMVMKKKNPHALYLFIIDIVYYKINTNAHIKTTNEIILDLYNIKQGPTETLLLYQHRAIAALEMVTRAQERHTEFLIKVKRPEESIIPGNTILMYSVLRGLNDNYNGFKMDVVNRTSQNKGDIPYSDITEMLNEADEFHSPTTSKGKSMISFAGLISPSKSKSKCEHCGGLHRSFKCWTKFPELKPSFPKKSTSEEKSDESSKAPRPNST